MSAANRVTGDGGGELRYGWSVSGPDEDEEQDDFVQGIGLIPMG